MRVPEVGDPSVPDCEGDSDGCDPSVPDCEGDSDGVPDVLGVEGGVRGSEGDFTFILLYT